jgi:hypothetical protein
MGMADIPKGPKSKLENVSLGSKEFYSAGASFSTLSCAAVVVVVWRAALGQIYEPLKSPVCALVLSALIVFAYAYVIPEPTDYPDAGRRRITPSEFVFGIFNIFIVYATAVTLEAL